MRGSSIPADTHPKNVPGFLKCKINHLSSSRTQGFKMGGPRLPTFSRFFGQRPFLIMHDVNLENLVFFYKDCSILKKICSAPSCARRRNNAMVGATSCPGKCKLDHLWSQENAFFLSEIHLNQLLFRSVSISSTVPGQLIGT